MQTERNMLIEAHQAAGTPYLAAKILLLFADDVDPAVRRYILGELNMMLTVHDIAQVAEFAADRALALMKRDTGEQHGS